MAKPVKKEKRSLVLNGILTTEDFMIEGEEDEVNLKQELEKFDSCDITISITHNY